MDMTDITARGLVILGCGKMGSAMLEGWIADGLAPESVTVLDPTPSDFLKSTGCRLNAALPERPALVLLAVKPQMMQDALAQVTHYGGGDVPVLTVAAGLPIRYYERAFGAGTPVIRAMPNTPSAVKRGITAIVGNEGGSAYLDLAEELLSAVGQVVRLESETQMRTVTGISGSGPAYVFHMVEALTEAGIREGLSEEIAGQLARATISGAGALLDSSDESAAQLRTNVTSPKGVTEAALRTLMEELPDLMHRTVKAAIKRDEELSK
ncbi:pyrroline-5-carboxylate reductase [Tropicimonas sp. IMCC34011]|uniref:pyrroline-5-carboxylate reductase n=1 Tax=Tropicimonas sp. IMCC34011 TaxID=2248759 RepID=UPI000E261653|nr:pyrroline-5-carboxylate reductase [Tropicimonas sp. IMCC34011]